ncbi:MAG: NUDIX hydrolase [Candidatus Sericytochromatia bacterium]|nr:NUDIX hydrolase [Candidatus Sericytochromatia bacterium]
MVSRKDVAVDDSQLRETQLSSQVAFTGRMITVEVDQVRMPDGREATREIVRHPGAVAVIAVVDGQILFVKQYRHAVGDVLLELPAGKLEIGETPLSCGQRELEEETGMQAAHWTPLGKTVVSPGFTDEVIHLFRAEGLSDGTGLVHDADEFIAVERMTLSEALAAIDDGRIIDAKTQIALLLTALPAANRSGVPV